MLLLPSLFAQQPKEEGNLRQVVKRAAPNYPELARTNKLTGKVRVAVVVARKGEVKSMQVMGGSPVLGQAAMDAINQWKWKPAPKETTEIVEMVFNLDN